MKAKKKPKTMHPSQYRVHGPKKKGHHNKLSLIHI